jgi:RNA polymerase sigma-70 factor (ECF subfamily)
MSLTDVLHAHLAPGRPADEPADIEPALRAMTAAAATAWPDVRVPDDVFVAHVAARLPEGPLAEALAALRGDDLYLACACGRGDPAALAAFEATYGADLRGALGRFVRGDAATSDLAQQVRERLFVGKGASAAKIGEYSGRGQLRNWLKAVTARVALNALDGARRELPLEDEMMAQMPSTSDPLLDHMKRTYRAEFKAAFQATVQALSAEDRTLLSQHFIDGLNIDEIALIHGVHRATAARWLGRARDAILVGTRSALTERLGTSKEELESIMRLIASDLEVSMRRCLQE